MNDNLEVPDLSNLVAGPDGAPILVMPDNFIGPHKMPVAWEVTGVYDHEGTWWIMYRVETVHGSFVAFASPESAKTVRDETDNAIAAEATTPFVPPEAPPG